MRVKVIGDTPSAIRLRALIERDPDLTLGEAFVDFQIDLSEGDTTHPIIDGVDGELERLVVAEIGALTPSGQVLLQFAAGHITSDAAIAVVVPTNNVAEQRAVEHGLYRGLLKVTRRPRSTFARWRRFLPIVLMGVLWPHLAVAQLQQSGGGGGGGTVTQGPSGNPADPWHVTGDFEVAVAPLNDVTATGTIDALNESVTLAIEGRKSVSVNIAASGTYNAQFVTSVSSDGGTTWTVAPFYDVTDKTTTTFKTLSNAGIVAPLIVSVHLAGGETHVRVTAGDYTSGTFTASLRATESPANIGPSTAEWGGAPPAMATLVGGVDGFGSSEVPRIISSAPDSSEKGLVVREVTTVPVSVSGTIDDVFDTVDLALQGRTSASVQITSTSTYDADFIALVSYDGGTTWQGRLSGIGSGFFDQQLQKTVSTLEIDSGAFPSPRGGALLLRGGETHVRVKAASVSSGTFTVTLQAAATPSALSAEIAIALPSSSASGLVVREAARGQTAMTGSIPVAIASDQSAIPITGTVTANAGTNLNTSALLTTSAHDAAFGTAGTPDAQVRSVQGVAGGTALPISAASLPLPTGAATSALQTTGNTSLSTLAGAVAGTEMQVDVLTLPALPAGNNNIGDVDVASFPDNEPFNLAQYGGTNTTLGQKAMAASMPVVIASDQAAFPVTANAGTNLNTSALNLEATQADVRTALQIMDDWDESDRAKANIIVGQAGITAGAGAVAANTPRVTHASDDPVTTALQVIDDWDESDRAKVNPIAGQVGVQGGAGAVTALTQRVALANDANVVSTKAALTFNAPTAATVGVASAQALAANVSRRGLVAVNTSNNTISCSVAQTAVLNSGITLEPGAVWTMNEYTFATGAVNCIASAGSSNLSLQEMQ